MGDLCEAEVGWVGVAIEDGFSAPCVPFPDESGVLHEALWGGEFLGVVIGPETGLGVPESGDAAFGGDSGSGEAGDGLGIGEAGEEFLGQHVAQSLC